MPTITPLLAHLVQGAKGEGIVGGFGAKKKDVGRRKKDFKILELCLAAKQKKEKERKIKESFSFVILGETCYQRHS